MSWSRAFDDPVSGRKPLRTLLEAGDCIAWLPKEEHAAPEWQAPTEALTLVAEGGGPTMLARISMMRALNRDYVRELNPKGKEPHWGRIVPRQNFFPYARRVIRPVQAD
jgi:hypothetical protein